MPLKTILYVSHADGREVHVMEQDPNSGDLSLIEKVSVSGVAMPMAVSPDRRYLYVCLRSEPYSVASFRIDPETGRLSPIATTKLPDNFAYISTDRSGRFLLGASFAGNKMAVNPIGPHGWVQERPVQIFGTPPNAHCVLTDPSNRFAYVPCRDGNAVVQLRFDAATGMVSPNDPLLVSAEAGAGPRHARFHPNNAFLYLMNELDGSTYVYAIDATTGTLSRKQIVDARPPGFKGDNPAAADIHLTPDGHFLYGTVRTSNTIAGFSVDPTTGLLDSIGHWSTEDHPRGFAICPRGRFLYAVGLNSHHLQSYRIEASGKLKPLKRLEMGKGPNWIEVVDLP